MMFKGTPADGVEHKKYSDHWRNENEITGPAGGGKGGIIEEPDWDPIP